LRVYEFNGSTWTENCAQKNIGTISNTAHAALSPNSVAIIDNNNSDLRNYQWSSPLLYVASNTDFPYLSVSDAGYTTAEALSVRTELRVGQSATSTAATSSPALIVSGKALFLSDTTVYGKIGIGTTSPNQSLTIFSSTTPSLEFSATSGDTNKWTLGIDTADQWKFKIASSSAVGTNTRFTIDGAGNIGIGTTSPAARLHVFNTASTPQFRIGYDKDFFADFQVDAGGDLTIGPSGTTSPSLFNSVRITDDNLFICSGACPSPDIGNGMIASAGNLIVENQVGIGTSTPNWKLQVAGVNTSNSTKAFLVLSDFSAGANLKHWFFSSQGGNLYVGTTTDGYATSTALTILNGGNIGIGTTSPFRLLSVAGTTTVGELHVQNNASSTTQTPDIDTLYRDSVPKAWVSFNCANGSIRGAFNVSSVTRTIAGDYTVNFTTAMRDTNYVAMLSGRAPIAGGQSNLFVEQHDSVTRTTTALRLYSLKVADETLSDCSIYNVVIFGH
ncbi:MAG: hypothetical protein HYS44_03650, partial [Candidatus Niyogibacteria bacterium]|nr:hypothetical protein [Candidatus Niyogibacteria bacterium]